MELLFIFVLPVVGDGLGLGKFALNPVYTSNLKKQRSSNQDSVVRSKISSASMEVVAGSEVIIS